MELQVKTPPGIKYPLEILVIPDACYYHAYIVPLLDIIDVKSVSNETKPNDNIEKLLLNLQTDVVNTVSDAIQMYKKMIKSFVEAIKRLGLIHEMSNKSNIITRSEWNEILEPFKSIKVNLGGNPKFSVPENI